MSKYVVFTAVLTITLLVGWGCEQKSANVAMPTPPAQAVAVKPEPVKIEQSTPPEPNTPKAPAAEQNVQAAKPAEPNKPQKVTPVENVTKKPKSTSPVASTTAAQLCGKCTEFLRKYVNRDGMVDYKTLARKKLELAALLDKFRGLNRNDYNSWSKDDKLAFWINGYNLELIRIIIENYPIESNRMLRLFWPPNSIRHIKGIWDEHKFIIMDEEFTLREIEQRFFQNEFGEPRVLFAMSYASISGVPLRNEAYCGQNLSAQLDDQVKKFIAGSHALKIDRENQTVSLSSLLNPTWYGGQFVTKYGTDLKFKQQEPALRAVLHFLTKYISQQDIDYLETGNYTIGYLRYDWTLNEGAGQ
ncbi:MAG: DUF547 domain-containing protein [Sedimentisphaerales bacterium]|jgi:hypothetical protein